MAPAEPGEPARVRDALHRGADLAQRAGGGGDGLRLGRREHRPGPQAGALRREWTGGEKKRAEGDRWTRGGWMSRGCNVGVTVPSGVVTVEYSMTALVGYF